MSCWADQTSTERGELGIHVSRDATQDKSLRGPDAYSIQLMHCSKASL